MDPLHSILTALMSELDVYQRCSPLPLLSVISLLSSLLESSESQALPLSSDMGKRTLETFFGSAQKGFPPRSPAPVAPSRSLLSPGARQPLQAISNNVRKRKRADIPTDTIDLTISDEEDAVPSRIERLDSEDDLTDPDEEDAEPSKINALGLKAISVQAVICVGRYSCYTIDPKKVQQLHDNNRKLYKKFTKYIHPTLHPTLHECQPGDCPMEFKSITFNGWSSNSNMFQRSGKEFAELTSFLTTIAKEVEPNSYIALIFSSQDGLFTNVLGVRQYFKPFESLNIVLHMYVGGSSFQNYRLSEVLEAVGDFEAQRHRNTPVHQLVLDWMKVSYNKVALSVAQQDNRSIMGRKRNTIDPDSDEDESVITESSRTISSPPITRGSNVVSVDTGDFEMRTEKKVGGALPVIKIELEMSGERYKCPECVATFVTVLELEKHLAAISRTRGVCVLCPDRRSVTRGIRTHISYHLPARKQCDQCDWVGRHGREWRRHKLTHQQTGETEDEQEDILVHGEKRIGGYFTYCHHAQCDKVGFNRLKNLSEHLEVVHGEKQDLYRCEQCGAVRNLWSNMQSHMQRHKENEAIFEFGVNAGVFRTEDEPMGASAICLI